MNEKQSYTEYNVIVPTQDFTITFEDYNSNNRDAINVTVDDVPATTAGFTVLRISDTVIQLTPAVESGSVVRLQRETDIDNTFYQFTAGAIFTAGNVDKNFQQVLHSQQEVRDGFIKLANYVYPLADGLEQALQTASTAAVAASAASEAASAASEAAQIAAATAETASARSKYMLNYYDPAYVLGGASYPINSRLTLANGDVVISTIPNNTNNPDVDMTGWELALPHVDTEGTYTKVTTDEYGRVVSGENPDTLAGMGITDAYTKTEVDTAIATGVVADATTTDKGIVRLATESDITNSSASVALTPKNVNDMLIGVGASAKGFRALFSARLTEMVGTNTSSGTTITATITAHGLSVGDVILVNYRYLFFSSTQQASDVVTITSVPNANTFVFTSPRPATGSSTGGTCTVSYAIKSKYNINSLTVNAVGRYTIEINTASGINGTSFIPFVVATSADNTVIHAQPEAIASATSLTVRTFNSAGTAITPQWLHVGVTQ